MFHISLLPSHSHSLAQYHLSLLIWKLCESRLIAYIIGCVLAMVHTYTDTIRTNVIICASFVVALTYVNIIQRKPFLVSHGKWRNIFLRCFRHRTQARWHLIFAMKSAFWKCFHHYFSEMLNSICNSYTQPHCHREGISMKVMKIYLRAAVVHRKRFMYMVRRAHIHTILILLEHVERASQKLSTSFNCFYSTGWLVGSLVGRFWFFCKRANSRAAMNYSRKRHYDEHWNTIQFNKSIHHVSSIR